MGVAAPRLAGDSYLVPVVWSGRWHGHAGCRECAQLHVLPAAGGAGQRGSGGLGGHQLQRRCDGGWRRRRRLALHGDAGCWTGGWRSLAWFARGRAGRRRGRGRDYPGPQQTAAHWPGMFSGRLVRVAACAAVYAVRHARTDAATTLTKERIDAVLRAKLREPRQATDGSPSVRQSRVAAMLQVALASVLDRGAVTDTRLYPSGLPIQVMAVSVSPCLRFATFHWALPATAPSTAAAVDEVTAALHRNLPTIKEKLVAQVQMKVRPCVCPLPCAPVHTCDCVWLPHSLFPGLISSCTRKTTARRVLERL